jgi:hypothetical protein
MGKLYSAFCRRSLLLLIITVFFLTNTKAQVDFTIGTGTTGNANTTYPCPLQDYYEGSRMQFLYRASELTATGMGAGNIVGIKFNAVSLTTSTGTYPAIEQFTIKIGTTATTSLGTSTWETVTATVYGPTNYMTALGVNTFTFTSPFFWNGTDNIVIEICCGDPNNTSDIYYTGNPVIPWTSGLSFNGSHSYRADNLGNLCGTATTTNTGDQATRPNIVFTAAPAGPCINPPTPGTVTASSNPVCMGTSFTLGLNGGTTGTSQTYQWQSSPDNVNWTDIGGATNSTLATSQTENMYYRSKVTCGTTVTSGSLLVTTNICYCPSIPTSTIDEEIFSVTVNGATNAYNCTTVAPGPGSILNRYSNFYTLGPLTTLIPGTTVPFTIQEDECDGPTYYNNGCAVWIDFNRNGVFTDPGEQVYVENALSQSPRTISGNFTVPVTASPGLVGMRIIVAENYSGTALQPCMTYTYGETEDYIINIAPNTPCAGTPDAGSASSSKLNVCAGENFILSLTGSTIASALGYRWQSSTDNVNWSDIAGATSIFYTTNQSVSHYYRNVVTCTNGGASDTSSAVQVVVLNGPPTATISTSPADTVCSGTNVTLSTANCTGCTFLWSNGATTNSIDVSTGGYYSVNVVNSCGDDHNSKEIIYKPGPSLSINAANEICAGSSTQLTANGASTYSWAPAAGLNTTSGAVVMASPTTTTTYTVTGYIGTCSKDLSVTVTVNPIPAAPTISASGPTSFCTGSNVTLTSSATANNQWYKDGAVIAGATNQTYIATTAGNYTVKTSSNSCGSNASAATAVTINPVPAQAVITQVGNALQSSAASGNQWFLNGLVIPGATGASFTPNSSGPYTVQVTTNGCLGPLSEVFNYTMPVTVNPVVDGQITIAPNPVRGMLSVRYTGNGTKFWITLVNTNGAVVYQNSFTTSLDIDMSKFSAGLYVVRVIDEKVRNVNEKRGDVVQRMILKL